MKKEATKKQVKPGNTPFTADQVYALKKGFNPSCQYMGRNEKGEEVFYPNRKQRRAIKQKNFRKPKLAVERIQRIGNKTIYHYRTAA